METAKTTRRVFHIFEEMRGDVVNLWHRLYSFVIGGRFHDQSKTVSNKISEKHVDIFLVDP